MQTTYSDIKKIRISDTYVGSSTNGLSSSAFATLLSIGVATAAFGMDAPTDKFCDYVRNEIPGTYQSQQFIYEFSDSMIIDEFYSIRDSLKSSQNDLDVVAKAALYYNLWELYE